MMAGLGRIQIFNARSGGGLIGRWWRGYSAPEHELKSKALEFKQELALERAETERKRLWEESEAQRRAKWLSEFSERLTELEQEVRSRPDLYHYQNEDIGDFYDVAVILALESLREMAQNGQISDMSPKIPFTSWRDLIMHLLASKGITSPSDGVSSKLTDKNAYIEALRWRINQQQSKIGWAQQRLDENYLLVPLQRQAAQRRPRETLRAFQTRRRLTKTRAVTYRRETEEERNTRLERAQPTIDKALSNIQHMLAQIEELTAPAKSSSRSRKKSKSRKTRKTLP
jgi:hypothetical protein